MVPFLKKKETMKLSIETPKEFQLFGLQDQYKVLHSNYKFHLLFHVRSLCKAEELLLVPKRAYNLLPVMIHITLGSTSSELFILSYSEIKKHNICNHIPQ